VVESKIKNDRERRKGRKVSEEGRRKEEGRKEEERKRGRLLTQVVR